MAETDEKINQLQIFEQSMQNIVMQKQQFQAQISELNSALKELETTKNSYKIIGNIMVNTDKETLTKDLKTKKSTAELRIKTLEKQEESIREKTKSLQSEVMQNMDKK